MITFIDTRKDTNILSFSKMRSCGLFPINSFQYDYISNADIDIALNDPLVHIVNPHIDHEDDYALGNNEQIPDELKHAYRVAAIILDFKHSRELIEPIMFDTHHQRYCGFCVSNGHHRIRALQYMEIDQCWFAMSGSVDLIESVVAECSMSS